MYFSIGFLIHSLPRQSNSTIAMLLTGVDAALSYNIVIFFFFFLI